LRERVRGHENRQADRRSKDDRLEERQHGQVRGRARNDVPVDGVLREFWLQDAEQIKGHGKNQSRNQHSHVGLQVTQQPARDLPVVRLTNLLFLVEFFDCG
jgi:hypothetical protein